MKPKNFDKIHEIHFIDNRGIDRFFEIDALRKDWIWVFDLEHQTRNVFRFEFDWASKTFDVLTVKHGKGIDGKVFHNHKGCKIKRDEYKTIKCFTEFITNWLEVNNEYTNKNV